MPISQLEKQLIRHEGFRAHPYRCTAGKLTIGCGRNLDARGITEDEAIIMLRNDIAHVERRLGALLPWWSTLDPARKDALTNMGFNLGVDGLLAFGGTLDHIRLGEYDEAAKHMLGTLWARQVGARAVELANQMRTGKYRES